MNWTQSAVDSCLYRLYDPKSGALCGLLSKHIDDCFCCGAGKFYEDKVTALRKEFPFGQWICAQDMAVKYCGSTVQ